MFLLKKYFNDFYKSKFFTNNLLNIKDLIIENKIDIILLDESLLENNNVKYASHISIEWLVIDNLIK